MRELVAIDLAGGPAFVDALRRAWDDGNAVLPVDQRLPGPARTALLDAARPHVVITDAGRTHHDRGAPPVGATDAIVVASSGTTGPPKLVVHSHAGIQAHAHAVHAHLGVDSDHDRWLACLPLAHLGGLGVVVRALVTDTAVDVWPSFEAARVTAAPAQLGTTLIALVPTALDQVDPAPFRWVVLGGSADPTTRPGNVVHTYGLTETGGGVIYGGQPLPGVEIKIGPAGEIFLRGPMFASGRREADGSLTSLANPDGWLDTGDLGRWSQDGRLLVDGRADDLIVTGGENVWPAVVEAALADHPDVADIAVVGQPDPIWGQRVVAIVVATEPGRPPTLDDLRTHGQRTIPAFATPRELVLVDRLPRTVLGKIQRSTLSE